MHRLFSSRKRFIGLGAMSALVIALAVLGTLWGFSQRASANDATVALVHVEPGGGDYTGNPYCPDTDWSGGKNAPVVNPAHDCNNITGQNHLIRTSSYVTVADDDGDTLVDEDCWGGVNDDGDDQCDGILDNDGDGAVNDGCPPVGPAETTCDEWPWDCQADPAYCDNDGDGYANDGCVAVGEAESGPQIDEDCPNYDMGDPDRGFTITSGVGTIVVAERCGMLAEVQSRPNWDHANDGEMCAVIANSIPGETIVTFSYFGPTGLTTTAPVIKEWDTIVDSVILKGGDENLVKVYYDADGNTVIASTEYKSMWLVKDVNGDGVRDADDEDLLDKQSTWQDHGVVFDEALKRIKSPVPIHIIEVVHGEHDVLTDGLPLVTVRQPTEGAIILAEIESERGCTYFTNATGTADYGSTLGELGDLTTDSRGRFLVWVDTVCEEQAVINFYANFPPGTGSLRLGLYEWVGINWTTIEEAKQPQIRWAGEEIVLEKRWALPGDWYPVADANADTVISPEAYPDGDACPYVDRYVKYIKLDGPGGLVSGVPEVAPPAFPSEPDVVWARIDENCVSRALYSSEEQGQVDVEAVLYTSDLVQIENKHAFLVWYLKVYQVKLTNVDGERADHNAGKWSFGDGEDTVEDTLNVSQDALLRVTVKGWFEGGNNSGRGAVCVDIDGDGNELEGEDASEPGEPYPILFYEDGCDDPDDEILDHGHWVLPDDLPALAGPDAINTRRSWDVMSEAAASSTGAVGPKSTLDSHDAEDRDYVPGLRKTVAPDGAITAADAIMPPLKIRASIADGDAGFLKQALKSDVYGSKNDYHSIMIPASPEIPPIVNNGGYDWDSWVCHDAINQDVDGDGIANAADNCPFDKNNNQANLDADSLGDVCDADIDSATGAHPNATDVCDYNAAVNVVGDGAADADSDGVPVECDIDDTKDTLTAEDHDQDGVADATDKCPTTADPTNTDTDSDGEGDVCDLDPANAPIPLCTWTGLGLGPYEFWTIINKFGAPDPYYIEFYTDNRGEGMFFANGDYNLTFVDCRTDPVSGTPVCDQGDVVGESNITVIGDYPYFRKHSAVQSNDVVKTWEWGGFKRVSHERIDATHIAIIAHLKDRDGFCKYKVGSDPTKANAVQFSPSLNPVQGEEIEFILNTEVGSIITVSPNGVYSPAPPHDPLGKGRVTGLADGVIINRGEAVALAEDERVLDYYDEARPVREDGECQAWIVIQHPLGEDPDVSVIFHDPEGDVVLHWPVTELIVGLVQGWNDVCYVDDDADVEDAMADFIDDVLAVYLYDATDTEDAWKAFFPDNADLSDLDVLLPYDQLFVLMAASADWTQAIQALPDDVVLVGASAEDEVAGAWNSVCYAGPDKATSEATSDIEGDFVVMYTLGSDQAWRRYVPGRPEIPDTLTTLHRFDSVILLVTAEGGTTWVFDP